MSRTIQHPTTSSAPTNAIAQVSAQLQGVTAAAITIAKQRAERLHVIRKRCEERRYGQDFLNLVREVVGLEPDEKESADKTI